MAGGCAHGDAVKLTRRAPPGIRQRDRQDVWALIRCLFDQGKPHPVGPIFGEQLREENPNEERAPNPTEMLNVAQEIAVHLQASKRSLATAPPSIDSDLIYHSPSN
jgi:hypothetical protein